MSQWFDPRLTVFIIWGIFVILFICVPSKRVMQKLCRLVGCGLCGYDEEIAPSDNSGHGMHYQMFSNSRKQELDCLRASILSYRLYPCSLTIEKKHMVRCSSDSESPAASPNTDSPPQDRIEKNDQFCTSHSDDIETGTTRRGIDPPECDEEERNDESRHDEEKRNGEVTDVEYTHVSVPLPGHNFDCVKILDSDDSAPVKDEKKSKIRLFSSKEKEMAKEAKEKPTPKDINENGERRSCPIFCAICLNEYETSERVSWSSNPACTHVFHEECITQWLVSLGRTKSKMQQFSDDPSEAQLLNYELECPCCRQEFIETDNADLVDARGGEESV